MLSGASNGWLQRRRGVGRVALVIGAVWLVAAAVWFQAGYEYARTLLRAEGVVVGNCGTNGFLPRVEFTPAGGAPIRSCAGKFAHEPANFRVGQRVEVLYRADDPTEASINSVDEFWLCPSVMAVLALFVGVPSLSRRSRRRPSLSPREQAAITTTKNGGSSRFRFIYVGMVLGAPMIGAGQLLQEVEPVGPLLQILGAIGLIGGPLSLFVGAYFDHRGDDGDAS